jgi:Fe-S cluster biogenesis protein NfuA
MDEEPEDGEVEVGSSGTVVPAPDTLEEDAPSGADLNDAERGERLSQADGGDLALLSADVATGVVEVQLQGACSSCAVSASTLQGGVERILRDRLPWVTEVTGGVDEAFDPFESQSMGRGGYVPNL